MSVRIFCQQIYCLPPFAALLELAFDIIKVSKKIFGTPIKNIYEIIFFFTYEVMGIKKGFVQLISEEGFGRYSKMKFLGWISF